LRLLDALDPSPDSPSSSTSIALLLSRALPSTIGPAISSARVRLIIILVLIALFSLVGGMWVVARTYAWLAKYREHFRENVCGEMEIVFIPSRHAKGLQGMSEERVRKWFRDREGELFKVIGVFAVP
jgi:hypothetical protein